jgi:hypothetical protein
VKAPAEDTYRQRLEGRAELLEAALPRYRLLWQVLSLPQWRPLLRQHLPPLREALAAQTQVEEALDSGLRRAEAENWAPHAFVVRCMHEVRVLQEEVRQKAAARLRRPPHEPLTLLLTGLEESALTEPRSIAPHEYLAVARQLLANSLPLVQQLSTHGQRLESLFRHPFDPRYTLPFAPALIAELRQAWAQGESALAAAWARLEAVDTAGGLVQELTAQARREPSQPPRQGPEWLLHATYWQAQAHSRLGALARERLTPLVPYPAESQEVALWLCAREQDPLASLSASASLPESRAGLFEMALELWLASHPSLSEEERWTPDRWQRLAQAARRADSAPPSPDSHRLHLALRELLQSRLLGSQTLRGWKEPPLLEELVLFARSLLS